MATDGATGDSGKGNSGRCGIFRPVLGRALKKGGMQVRSLGQPYVCIAWVLFDAPVCCSGGKGGGVLQSVSGGPPQKVRVAHVWRGIRNAMFVSFFFLHEVQTK